MRVDLRARKKAKESRGDVWEIKDEKSRFAIWLTIMCYFEE